MKRITILRHAKSDWAYEQLKDIDRPLNERGYMDAYEGSGLFSARGEKPDMLYVSTATRALSTAFIFARAMEMAPEKIQLASWYYETDSQTTLSFLKKLQAAVKHVMLVGHNPASTNMVNALVKSGGIDDLPTCGLISIDCAIKDWSDLSFHAGEIHYYQYPKMNKKI